MLKAIIISVVILGLAILGMCVRIILKKNGTFHSQDVGQSKAMRDRGIGCTRSQDRQAQRGNPLRLNTKEL
ncbi:MAG: hypothetical protein J5688_03285 [Paludibacteraceae bacterium]|nr:hypothetical protein [Paludibacteraceae bacterium]